MAFPSKSNALKRAAAKADMGPEREEPGELEPRRSNPRLEAAEEKREKS